jgi:hypothetical protein
LKGILADKVPKEQERVKNFRKAHGATKVGEVTVEMVSQHCKIRLPLNITLMCASMHIFQYIQCNVL